ncbi:MAG: hypothetical protein BWX71_02530 [Deltaproteobacteria bacterium ADurb.Bin072]|nr:MAG: hypothetical protein BWX71_02530 [Deltaproteobacteria bacterium ADurb.Bin072]
MPVLLTLRSMFAVSMAAQLPDTPIWKLRSAAVPLDERGFNAILPVISGESWSLPRVEPSSPSPLNRPTP